MNPIIEIAGSDKPQGNGGSWCRLAFQTMNIHINFYTPHLGTWAEAAVS